ncbi:MAG: acyloxyacyl hydrolase [Saprospiraceae bacterium]
MNTKFSIFLVLLLFIPISITAQIEKGWMLVGGNAGFDYQADNEIFTIGIRPNHAFFVRDNLAVGAAVSINVILSEGEGTWVYGASPLVRYYFTGKKAIPFVEGRIGISGISDSDGNTSDLYNGGLTFGVSYFVEKHVAVELGLMYDHTRTGFKDYDTDLNNLSLGFGFQIHLERNKIKEQRN